MCGMEVSLNQTDANCSSQRSSMQGQQCPLSFLQRRQASLRVNTCTDACGRGSSPAPYSPPSAETAVGRGEGLTLTRMWEGQISAYKLCPQTPVKGGVFFCQHSGHKKLLFARQKLIQEAQTNICRYSLTKWRPSPPIFQRKKGGGHTTSQIALPA